MGDEQWNNNRGQGHSTGSNYGSRKQGSHSYSDNKGKNYSPSASFNYTQNSRGQGGGQNYQQNPRRRSDRFKRESINSNDKLVRQNDLIIKLLKEIRDALVPKTSDIKVSNTENESTAPNENNKEIENSDESVKETTVEETPEKVAKSEESPIEDIAAENEDTPVEEQKEPVEEKTDVAE